MLVDLVLEGLVTLLSLAIVVVEHVVSGAATEPHLVVTDLLIDDRPFNWLI